ncbi:MAG: YbhB/YbcL family Raf kinase inhibitor-like protein [Archangium sp.]
MTNPYDALPAVPSFTLASRELKPGEPISRGDVSPHLTWSGAPPDTKSFALTMFDADAPTPSGFWHWAVMGIPPSVSTLERGAGAANGTLLPRGAVQLPNDARVASFIGVAPPAGHGPHRYFIVVHALDVETLPIPNEGTPAYLSFLMLKHTLARATLVVTAETKS